MKSFVSRSLLLAGLVVSAHWLWTDLPDRQPLPERRAAVRFEAVGLDARGFAPLRLAGAWRVTSPEPRMGGVSALAVEQSGLLALTDSGVTIRLPKPGNGSGDAAATFSDLPAGPGRGYYKAGRDSEAVARDWSGRGWWIGFENRHSAWLFDRQLHRAIRTIDLMDLDWPSNTGVEGAVSDRDGLLLFPERGNEMVRISATGVERLALANGFGRLSDAARLPDGRIILLARTYSPAGFAARLLIIDRGRIVPLAKLALGRLDNAEAIAAEALPGGGLRFWVMTDNDFRRRVPTLLVALEWAG